MAFSDSPQLVSILSKNSIELIPSRICDDFYVIVSFDFEIFEGKEYRLYISAKPYSYLSHTLEMLFTLNHVRKNKHGVYVGTGIAKCCLRNDGNKLVGMRKRWNGIEHIGVLDEGSFIVFNKSIGNA